MELDDIAVAIEAEFAPARTVRQDATKRLPAEALYWRGLPVTSVFTLVYPKSMKRLPESDVADKLAQCESLAFAQGVRSEQNPTLPLPGMTEGDIEWITSQAGSVRDLAELLHGFWVRSGQTTTIEETVAAASHAIADAARILERAPTLQQVDDGDPAATCALIWLNALLFQELLAKDLSPDLLPAPHRGKVIRRPHGRPDDLLRQWYEILEINWYPIFDVARSTLADIPSPLDVNALDILKPCARTMAENQVIRRHDVAGRIFHRLLETRKFLATNYTTIPAAVLLAELAFDDKAPCWEGMAWDDPDALAHKLRVVDPACGSGTLLMAAVQEVIKRHRRAHPEDTASTIKVVLENSILGYDVVPSAVHLTATTLSMAETRQVLHDLPIYRMPHDVNDRGLARLGSLDFLHKAPNHNSVQSQDLFVKSDAVRTTGTGETKEDVRFPDSCTLIISNPPYTRAGGPGSVDNTDWNPVFGSVLSKRDQNKMHNALTKTLKGTPGRLYAGLGSAFMVLADERLAVGGRLAFVLPATVLTGSRWAPIRKMLLDRYDVEWVVVSHDDRNRSAKSGLPGRLYIAFSESTRMAEALIVATKRDDRREAKGRTRFVNLRQIPDEPIEAMAIARALLVSREVEGQSAITVGKKEWGEVISVKQKDLSDDSWAHATFIQSDLTQKTITFRDTGIFGDVQVPLAPLGNLSELGPYHMQIKNPTQGLFDIVETDDVTAWGEPAIWHHSSKRMLHLRMGANARLRRRPDKSSAKQDDMLTKASHLHLAGELRHAPQRLAAVYTDRAMLGVRSWISLTIQDSRQGAEKTLCLWFNSTMGLLLRIVQANRPYLGRSGLPHELAYELSVLDVKTLTAEQLKEGERIFEDLASKTLQGFAQLAVDPVRRELDCRLAQLLGVSQEAMNQLANTLANEPLLTTRH
ncbi:MAG: hypothetical protein OXM03_12760 [Chloroflexota bacterium]|nr:hypothetical protein [Gemmatimonadota bacterium]MDE2841491.1 hypothetical protein [Chloroflexota bacterium]